MQQKFEDGATGEIQKLDIGLLRRMLEEKSETHGDCVEVQVFQVKPGTERVVFGQLQRARVNRKGVVTWEVVR